jgi:hypothetical protein
MKSSVWIAAIISLVGTGILAADSGPTAGKGDPRAAALMEEATKTRYTWDPQVTAVSGKFTWEQEGKAGAGSFRAVLHKRGGLTVTADGGGEVPADIKDHIGSLISHRTAPAPGSPKKPAPPAVILVEDDAHGPLIMTVGDPMQSTQRVKDGKLVQVNRAMAGKRFTIDVTDFEKSPDGRYFASAFTVTWWDAATGKYLEKQTQTTQGFEVADGQMFPRAEKVNSEKEGTTSALDIRYSNIKFERGQGTEAK